MDALKALVHRFGTQMRVNGVLSLTANGDPALMAAFEALGWSDPYAIEPTEAPVVIEEPAPAEPAKEPDGEAA